MFSHSQKFQTMSNPQHLFAAIAAAQAAPPEVHVKSATQNTSLDAAERMRFYQQVVERGGYIGC